MLNTLWLGLFLTAALAALGRDGELAAEGLGEAVAADRDARALALARADDLQG